MTTLQFIGVFPLPQSWMAFRVGQFRGKKPKINIYKPTIRKPFEKALSVLETYWTKYSNGF
jgi:hypothetical protein